MAKLLLILFLGGALADQLGSQSEPPLLIDASLPPASTPTLDLAR